MLADRPVKSDRLRLLDLYLLFPELADQMRLPSSARGWRNVLRARANAYWSTCDRILLFQQMTPIQKCALSLLDSTRLVVQDPQSRRWSVCADGHPILTAAIERNREDDEVVGFLAEVLLPLPLTGSQGLKARTGLIEWRYDET